MARGFAGKRVEAYRAGMMAIYLIFSFSHFLIFSFSHFLILL